MRKLICCIAGLLFLLNACKQQDEIFIQYVVPGGIVYTGRPESPAVYPGMNRVLLTWRPGTDRNIDYTMVYWNNYDDSLKVSNSGASDSIGVYINNLEEKYYSFYLRTFDGEGHSSVTAEVTGPVYGSKYISNLLTRPIINSVRDGSGTLTIDWGTADIAGGAVGVELLTYQPGLSQPVSQLLSLDDAQTIIPNSSADVTYKYRTLFLPSAVAIDTFSTDIQTIEVMKEDVSYWLKNYKRPFTYSSWDGARYGILTDWITTDDVKNKGGYGGFDDLNAGGSFGFEQWTTDVAIPNGKIYQTVSLSAGRYQFTVYFGGPANAGVGNTGNDERYLTVAAGNALPDIDNISSALAYASLVGVATTASKTIEFVLEAETSVSLGMQVRFTSTRQNIRVSSFELIKFSK